MEGQTTYICPVCGEEWVYDHGLDKFTERRKAMMERACGFKVSMVMFKPLCERCKEWLLYLANEGLLDADKADILKGGENVEETQEEN